MCKIILVALAIYIVSLLAVYLGQESLIFHPSKLAADYKFSIPGVEEVEVQVEGAILSALHFKNPNPKGLVFFLHGNAEDLSTWLTDPSLYERINYDLFMIDYRGFGKSTSEIESEEQLFRDVLTSWDYVRPFYKNKKIVVYGRSLGTPLAARLSAYLAESDRPDMTILVTPLYNLNILRERHYPWIPKFLMRYKFDTVRYIKEIKNKVLIL